MNCLVSTGSPLVRTRTTGSDHVFVVNMRWYKAGGGDFSVFLFVRTLLCVCCLTGGDSSGGGGGGGGKRG